MSDKSGMKTIKLLELLQDCGQLPEVTIKASCVGDWQRILADANADLTRQLCYYMEAENVQRVNKALLQIEEICREWRKRGPKD